MSAINRNAGALTDVMPGLRAGGGSIGVASLAQQFLISVPLGPPLLVDSTTYKQALFVAPANGCYIVAIWLGAAVTMGDGTNTIAFSNYDASANSARNVLAATNIDPDTVTTLEGLQLTLSATAANLQMDAGDVLNVTLVSGVMTTDGQGYVATIVINAPNV